MTGDTLRECATLMEKTAGVDADELMAASLALRPEKEQTTMTRVQAV